jgi:hypothetical protein
MGTMFGRRELLLLEEIRGAGTAVSGLAAVTAVTQEASEPRRGPSSGVSNLLLLSGNQIY